MYINIPDSMVKDWSIVLKRKGYHIPSTQNDWTDYIITLAYPHIMDTTVPEECVYKLKKRIDFKAMSVEELADEFDHFTEQISDFGEDIVEDCRKLFITHLWDESTQNFKNDMINFLDKLSDLFEIHRYRKLITEMK